MLTEMGGCGSGRSSGTHTADSCYRLDVAWMVRHSYLVAGARTSGSLSWTRGGHPSGSICYSADLVDRDKATLELSYMQGPSESREHVSQTIRLVSTCPNFGGRRWWAICPITGDQTLKLYLPPNGDRFAGRRAWRLHYNCQRESRRDRPFGKLTRLQHKLDCEELWGSPIRRPKGMHGITYQRHLRRYYEINSECVAEMTLLLGC